MKFYKSLFSFMLFLAVGTGSAIAQEGQGDVVYVPTPQVTVDTMLEMAKVSGKDFVIDLGSGDGRILITAAKRYGAHGFGVDLDTYLLNQARMSAKREGVADKVEFREENLFTTDLTRATVITSYLLPEMNEKLRPTLLTLKPGTRIVAHDYDMGSWHADEEKTLIVPEKTVGDPGKSYVFLYIVPARVAGLWESLVTVGSRTAVYEFDFDQAFQQVSGDLKVDNKPVRLPLFKMKGDAIRFDVDTPVGKHRFVGRVAGDVIEGTVTIGASGKPQKWTARLKRRDPMRMSALGGSR